MMAAVAAHRNVICILKRLKSIHSFQIWILKITEVNFWFAKLADFPDRLLILSDSSSGFPSSIPWQGGRTDSTRPKRSLALTSKASAWCGLHSGAGYSANVRPHPTGCKRFPCRGKSWFVCLPDQKAAIGSHWGDATAFDQEKSHLLVEPSVRNGDSPTSATTMRWRLAVN
jgi:hypothetical protein